MEMRIGSKGGRGAGARTEESQTGGCPSTLRDRERNDGIRSICVGYWIARCQLLPCHLKVPVVFLGQRMWSPAENESGDEGPNLRLWRFSELRWRVGECLRLTILCGFPSTEFSSG